MENYRKNYKFAPKINYFDYKDIKIIPKIETKINYLTIIKTLKYGKANDTQAVRNHTGRYNDRSTHGYMSMYCAHNNVGK